PWGAGVARCPRVARAARGSLEAAIASYLRDAAAPPPASCAIAIASPLTGDRVTMTHRDWSFSIESLRVQLGVDRVLVLNDFTALALALPTLSSGEREPVG